jgi:PAS domain S-box-containing protein
LPAALDALPTFIYVKDRDLRIVSASLSFCRALGVAREDLIGKRTARLLGEDGPLSERIDREVIETGTPRLGIVEKYTGPDGLHWVLTDKSPIKDDAGNIVGLVGTSIDITARKQAEEALEQSEARLRFLTKHMADTLWTMDLNFHTTYVSPSIERVLGFTPEERRLQSLQEIATPQSVEHILTELQRQLQFEQSGSSERDRTLTLDIEYYRKDGSTVWLETLIQAVRDDAGTLVGMAGVSRDVTERRQAGEALRESERKYRELFEQSVDAVNLVSADGRVVDANPAWFRLFGYTAEDVGLFNARDAYVDPGGRARFLEEIAKSDRVEDEVQFRRKDGSVFDCHRTVTVRRASDGSIVGFQTVFHDVTETRKAERALKESEEKYRTLFELSQDAAYLVRPDGTFVDVNQAWIDLIGCTRDDVSRYDAAHWYADPDGRKRYLERMAKAGAMLDDEVQLRRKDGTVFDCQRRIVARCDKDGNTVAFQGVMRDITAQKQAERALRDSEEKYRQLFDLSIAPISLIAPDGRMIQANDAWFHLFGYSREDMDSFRVWDIYPTRELRDQSVRRLVDSGTLLDDEARLKTKDGTSIDVLRSMVVRHNPDGSVLGYETVWRDITAQKMAEQALKDSEEKYRQLFDQSVAPISLAAPDGHIIEANDAWLQLFGYSREDLSWLTTYALYDDPKDRDRTIQRAREAGQLIDDAAQHRKKDGSLIEVLRSVSILRDSEGEVIGYQSVYRDVTDLKRAEEALRKSEEKFRALFEQSIAPISLISRDGRLLEANDAWFRLLGYSREDTASFNAVDLFPSPDMREEFVQQLLRSGTLDNYESQVRRKDGTLIDVVRSISVRYNPDGSVLGFQTVLRDVTELKKAQDEVLKSRGQLRQLALRIQEAREEERTTIAQDLHDHFGQELTALRLDLESLTSSRPPAGDEGLARIRGIIQLADRMSQEVRRVISEMRPGMLDDLGLCAAIDWQLNQFSQRTGVKCDVSLLRDDSTISPVQATALFRMLQELLSNVARHAHATKVSVSLECLDDGVVLTVSDNGRGISDQQVSSAASLGLLGIHERVRALGGDFAVRRGRGEGTIARVTVPLDHAPAPSTQPPAPRA